MNNCKSIPGKSLTALTAKKQCPYCNEFALTKNGIKYNRQHSRQRYVCTNCRKGSGGKIKIKTEDKDNLGNYPQIFAY